MNPSTRAVSRLLASALAGAVLLTLVGCQSEPKRALAAAKRPIIDMHLHALTFEEWDAKTGGVRLPNPITGKPAQAKTNADILRLTLEAMDRYNIKLGVVCGHLENVNTWKAKAPDRFLASAQFSGRPQLTPRLQIRHLRWSSCVVSMTPAGFRRLVKSHPLT